MDKPNIISYYTYRKLANIYDIKYKTKSNKPVTYNKLKHRIVQFESKKHILTDKQQLHNNMIKYIDGLIDENSDGVVA